MIKSGYKIKLTEKDKYFLRYFAKSKQNILFVTVCIFSKITLIFKSLMLREILHFLKPQDILVQNKLTPFYNKK